ncbi:MAG: hypothetical protein QG549_962 [Patescibacteria group bacterium]|nr:hypothetical protein [Patescibacteria group bacterium]
MSLFHRNISFEKHDPLANGLGDEIAAEQREPDAFTLDDLSADDLAEQWNKIVKDIEKDPDWFDFAND